MIILKFDELKDILRGVILVRELSNRAFDFVIGHCEILSSKTICNYRKSQILMGSFLDAHRVIKMDKNFATLNKLNKSDFAKIKSIEVVTGFMASTNNKQATNFGCSVHDNKVAGVFAQSISIENYMEKIS